MCQFAKPKEPKAALTPIIPAGLPRTLSGLSIPPPEVYPLDDSRASQVMRVAMAYAEATTEYARNVAVVEKIKSDLMTAEAKLSAAIFDKDAAELELKNLVNGEKE
jgi:hypothetical protein